MPATLIPERTGTTGHGRDYRAGVRAMVPWMFGIGPYGLVIGISAANAHIPTFAGWLTIVATNCARLSGRSLFDGLTNSTTATSCRHRSVS